jgi:guanylate kinase
MPDFSQTNQTTGQLVVISGPSGVGKGTVCKALLSNNPDWLWSVSATSRQPRTGEVDGKDYWFYSRSQFEQAIKDDGFFEWAEYNDNYYGTPIKPVEEALNNGTTILLEIDVQGALQVKARLPQAVLVMITPPDQKTLAARLTGRGTNTPDDIQQRLVIAEKELEQASRFDHIVINNTVVQCCFDIAQLVGLVK